MKNLSTILLLILVSCATTNDDSNQVCTSNCTFFAGRVSTVDSIGIPNISLDLTYRVGGELGSSTRIIGKTKTDANGFYGMYVFLKDSELGENSEGYFSLKLDSDLISYVLPDQYLKPNAVISGKPAVNYYSIVNRDTTFTNNFNIPKKGNIRIRLNNYNPIVEGDFFKVEVHINYSSLNSNWTFYQPYEGVATSANANPTILETPIILNEAFVVQIIKRKNGIITNENQEYFVDSPEIYELEFDY